MNYLKDYREGEKFVGTYLCKQKQILLILSRWIIFTAKEW